MRFSFQVSRTALISALAGVFFTAMSGCSSDDNTVSEPSTLDSLSVNETQLLTGELTPTEVLPGSLRPPTE